MGLTRYFRKRISLETARTNHRSKRFPLTRGQNVAFELRCEKHDLRGH